MERNYVESPDYDALEGALAQHGSAALRELLVSCIQAASANGAAKLPEGAEMISALEAAKERIVAYQTAPPPPTPAAVPPPAIDGTVSGAKRRRIMLRGRADTAGAKGGSYATVRDAALAALRAALRPHLRPPTQAPLAAAVYFEDDLKGTLEGHPRARIERALMRPHDYIGDGAAPDVAELFQLVSECGRLINLHDLLHSFAEKVDPDAGQPPPDPLQARFLRALAGLQHIGCIKRTSRKADHVQRLVLSEE